MTFNPLCYHFIYLMCWSIDESDVLAEMQGADQNVMATAGHQLRKEGLNDESVFFLRQIWSLGSARLYARVTNAHSGSSFISRQQIQGLG